jgi:mono/diheme cytochrome c family protein
MVYLENLPFVKSRAHTLRLGSPLSGKEAFAAKSCVHCHTLGAREEGKVDLLATARQERRLTGLAVELWNHRPRMERAAKARQIELKRFEDGEMADLLAYLFERGYFRASGSARRGARLLQAKSCNACHGLSGSGAPDLQASGEPFSAIRLAAGVWRHGPAMLAEMRKRSLLWPMLTDQDVADLLTYLNSE